MALNLTWSPLWRHQPCSRSSWSYRPHWREGRWNKTGSLWYTSKGWYKLPSKGFYHSLVKVDTNWRPVVKGKRTVDCVLLTHPNHDGQSSTENDLSLKITWSTKLPWQDEPRMFYDSCLGKAGCSACVDVHQTVPEPNTVLDFLKVSFRVRDIQMISVASQKWRNSIWPEAVSILVAALSLCQGWHCQAPRCCWSPHPRVQCNRLEKLWWERRPRRQLERERHWTQGRSCSPQQHCGLRTRPWKVHILISLFLLNFF